MNKKLQSVNQVVKNTDFHLINDELRELEFNDKNKTIFLKTIKFIIKQDSANLAVLLKGLDYDLPFFKLFLKECVKKEYPILHTLVTKFNLKLQYSYFNFRSEAIEYAFLFNKTYNINDYLKSNKCGISSRAIASWLGKNIIKNRQLQSQYLLITVVLAKLIKDKNKNDIILKCLMKAKEKNLSHNLSQLINLDSLMNLLKLRSLQYLTPWKVVLLLTDQSQSLRDVLTMSKSIVDANLENHTIERKNLSLSTLHDNLQAILDNKGDINFKLKKENLISSKKISRYNKKSTKWKFLIPRTNREVFKWGNHLGHCLGTSKYAYDFKNDEIVILGVYEKNKLKYALDISTINGENLHDNPGFLNHIEGKSGVPNNKIYEELRSELKNIGIIKR